MSLPIQEVISDICAKLQQGNRLLLQAPPGAGKTTMVPLALLNEQWLEGRKIIVLEPRRLAAITSARRMAYLLGEEVGEEVGYRVRLDSKVSARTRIEVVTEGIYLRMIQNDPELSDVGLVIFDEFHERSLQLDLSLALTLDAAEGLRDDLRMVLMSATLDGEGIAKKLNAPVITSEGRSFPVDICWSKPREREWLADQVVRTVSKALTNHDGSLLVFLPGIGEIRSVEQKLRELTLSKEVRVSPLYGALSRQEQDLAISPAPKGERKIVLTTNIAETSLTIEGVTVVIDSGLHRHSQYDQGTGMSSLVKRPISQASALQRAGRAGRTAPGVCYRLWSEVSHSGRLPFQQTEILSAELSSLLLETSLWGVNTPQELFWLDNPPTAAQSDAQNLLIRLGAIKESGGITEEGKKIAGLGVHPRLAAMILAGSKRGSLREAADLAALLTERDILRSLDHFEQADISLRLAQVVNFRAGRPLHTGGFRVDRGAVKRVVQLSDSWRSRLREVHSKSPLSIGALLALAFPDRVGQLRRKQNHRYLLSNGSGAHLTEGDPLCSSPFVVVASCQAREKDAKVFLAEAITKKEIEQLFESELLPRSELYWDSREKRVVAREVVRLGSLIFSQKPSECVDPEAQATAVISGIRELGLNALNWSSGAGQLRDRLAFLHRHFPENWSDQSDESLLNSAGQWLAPYLTGVRTADQFSRIDLLAALKSTLTWEQSKELDRLAPERITVPEGSKIRLDYSQEPPVLAVKLQMLFGATQTPSVGDGKVTVLVHLLSPAGRPVQITQDLLGFWDGSYEEVKKDMKGKYPRHPWPDNPREAVATRKTNWAIARSGVK